MAAARRGREAVVVEIAGRRDAADLLGADPAPPGVERRVGARVRVVTVEPRTALGDYPAVPFAFGGLGGAELEHVARVIGGAR